MSNVRYTFIRCEYINDNNHNSALTLTLSPILQFRTQFFFTLRRGFIMNGLVLLLLLRGL